MTEEFKKRLRWYKDRDERAVTDRPFPFHTLPAEERRLAVVADPPGSDSTYR